MNVRTLALLLLLNTPNAVCGSEAQQPTALGTQPAAAAPTAPVAQAVVAPAVPVAPAVVAPATPVAPTVVAAAASSVVTAPIPVLLPSPITKHLPAQPAAVTPQNAGTVAATANAAAASANAAAANAAAATAIASANTATNAAAKANAAASAATNAAANVVQPAAVSAPAQPAAIMRAETTPPVPVGRFWSVSQWAWHLFTGGLSFAMVVKALCILGNVLVQISPFPQVMRWDLRKCTGEADAAPYVSIAFGGCQWCFYGMFAWLVTNRSGFLILVQSNFLGAILGTYYVRTFYCNCRNEVSLASLQKYLSGVTSLALLQVCAMGVLPAERALFLTGLVSSFCSFIGATSVLVTVPAVLSSKDSRSIPGPYAIANLASSLVWSLCGYILGDPLVMIPNLFSSCCSATSLGLKVYYPSDFFATGSDKPDKLSLEEGEEIPIVAKKTFRKASEFTPLKLGASTCDTLACDSSTRLMEKIASFDDAVPLKPLGDSSARILDKISSFDPEPMAPVPLGDCTGGTGESY